jgi:hypothetical protein
MKSASWVCTGGYTFRVKPFGWLILAASIALIGYALWRWRQRWGEHQRAAEERLAVFIAQARPGAAPAAPPMEAAPPPAQPAAEATLAQPKLLFDAASKAAEAGEPAIAIQLYARLIARYPQSAFVDLARAAVQAQKERLAKP